MENKSDDSGFAFGMLGLVAFILAAIVWYFYRNAHSLFTLLWITTATFTLFIAVVLVQYSEGYSFREYRWIYLLGIPLVTMVCCIFLLLHLNSQLNEQFVSTAQRQDNSMIFAYRDLGVENMEIGLRQFSGLIMILLCEVFCFIAFLNYVAEQGSNLVLNTIANLTDGVARWIGLVLLLLFAAFSLVHG